MEEKICRNIVFSNHFRTSSTEVWTIKQKNSRKIVRTTFNVFRGTTSGRFFGMKEICSSFLVLVELNYSTFDVKISANLSKRQPTCPAEHLKVFLEGNGIVRAFWVSEPKYPAVGKKISGRVAKKTFHVSSTKLWGKITKVIYTIIIFFRTLSELFLFLIKN